MLRHRRLPERVIAMAERQTMHDFVRKHGVTMTCEQVDHNPYMDDGRDRMDHWRCTLKVGSRRATIVFSMGSGHHGKEPEAADVLNSMASDANSAVSTDDWREFARDMGMETEIEDPRSGRMVENKKAKKIFNACIKEHEQLISLLGHEATKELVYETEGL